MRGRGGGRMSRFLRHLRPGHLAQASPINLEPPTAGLCSPLPATLIPTQPSLPAMPEATTGLSPFTLRPGSALKLKAVSTDSYKR